MPIYLFWGSDEFRLNRAATELRDRALDANWASFNFDKIDGQASDAAIQALNQAMTPPFGLGSRFVWLQEATIFQRCPDPVLAELGRTLPVVPEQTVLLFTQPSKPDGRLKSTKLLQKHGKVQEFSTIPPWKPDLLIQQVNQAAKSLDLSITPEAAELLVDAVGNNTRQLYNELEKLSLYHPDGPQKTAGNRSQTLTAEAVSQLVVVSTQSSLQLAAALRQGHTAQALGLVTDLLNRNEPALRIVSTLVGQFRTWLWVKLLTDLGERNPQAIAQAAEVNNPKRIYFLQKEVRPLGLAQLRQTMALLLELETGLKRGAEPLSTFQTKVVEITRLFQ
ncbi:MAG: DNA polymerase III subunit delta [Cyanobacteria bacterium J06635_15]